MSDDENEDGEPHGLFLPEAPGDPIVTNVKFISITRLAPTRENAGRAFSAEELPDLGALKQTFGGGLYRVIARDAKRHVLAGGQRDYTLSGPSFPMDGSGPPPSVPAQSPVGAAQTLDSSRLDRLERMLERVLTQPAAQPPVQQIPFEAILKMQADASANMLTIVKEVMQAKPGQQEATHEIFLAGQTHAAAIYEGIIEAEREKAKESGGGDGDVEILRTVQTVFEGLRAAKKDTPPTNGNGNGKTPQ